MTSESFSDVQDVLAGQYQLERELGRGGMGTVYLAREVRLDRQVAVKVLPRHLGADPELRERFLREARTAAQLSHPHIVPIFRADEIDGLAFFTMAFVDGENLAERVAARGPLPAADAVRVLRETAWALAYAHARGLVHRDIKPENIMVERVSNRAIVTDFGIARDQLADSLTKEGLVLGSAHYMSPEQASGSPLDGRSDLYSLGVVGFQILSGQRPFEAAEAMAVMAQHVTRSAPLLSTVAPDQPSALSEVIDRCLRKSPSDRYQTGEELAEALEQALASSTAVAVRGDKSEMVDTGHARAIWLRASQLQAEAGTRLQERYRSEQVTEAGTSPGVAIGFSLRDVERAASEAGIGADYVAMAVAELAVPAAVTRSEVTEREERTHTRMLGTTDRTLSASEVVRASPRVVLDAIGRVFTAAPYSLRLLDTVGGHPLDGGIMVFDVPMFRAGQMMGMESVTMSYFSYHMTQLEVSRLQVVIKPAGVSGNNCEVTIYGDLRPGMRKNWKVDKWIGGSVATGGALAGGAFGVAALALGGLAVLTAGVGALAAGGVSLVSYRALYRYALRKGRNELRGLIGAIEGNVRAAAVFGLSRSADGHR
ncbi:MAG: serine/threonine protein kinase [Phycisphaerae bacterium]|nr:serine/threonine protein kinase [Gemmatimonadaceae bacterium]